MEDIMSAPAWFNYAAYVANKLAQLQAAEPDANWTAESMQAAFTAAGYSNDADGMYRHFVDYGNAENVSPSPYFVVSEYMANKLAQMQAAEPDAGWDMAKLEQAFKDAGLSAWNHYELYGQDEGISPSSLFDTEAYLAAKLAQLQATEPDAGWETVDQVVDAFQANGLNPVEHYMLYGINENLSYSPVTPEPAVTDELTTARDVLTLDGSDNIIGGVASALSAEKTLNENDNIDGGDGNDTLRVTLDANFNGFTVTDDPNTTGGMKNVENVELTNNGSITRTFSAKGSEGVTTYTLHAGEAGTGAINLKDLSAAGVTVNVDGLKSGTTDVQFASGALSGAEDSLTFGLNNVGAAAASATADPTYVSLKATSGLESVTINASGANYVNLSGVDAPSLAMTGSGALDIEEVNAALTSFDASAATGNVSAILSAATMQTVKGGAGDDTFVVKGLAPTAVLEGGAGNDTLIISESGAATLQPTVSGFENIGIVDNTGAVTLSAKNAQDFTTLLLQNTGANKVTVANLSGSSFTVESFGAEKGAATTNTAVIADAVDLTVNVKAGYDAEKAQTVTSDITAASATNAVINVDANAAAAGSFTFGAAQSVQLNVASNKVDAVEQTSFNGTITAAKAQSLEVKAEGELGANAKFEVASAASVVLDAAQGGTAAIVAGKATDVRLTAGDDLALTGSTLGAAQSVTVVQNDGKLDGSTIDLAGLNSLNVSGDGAKSAVEFKDLGSASNDYSLNVVANGLAAGFTAGTVNSMGDISLDFSAVSGDVKTGNISGADVSLVASQLGNNDFGTITATGNVDVQALGLLGDTFTLGDITAQGDNSNVSLVVDGTASVKTLANITATGSVNVDLSGYMGDALAFTAIKGTDVTYVGADLTANNLGTVTANSLNFTGGLDVDTVTLEGVADETSLTATLDTGTGTDVVTVNGVASTQTITVSGDLGGDGEAVTVSGAANVTSGMTINIGGLTGYATSAITGTNFSDTITGGSGNDTITAGDVAFGGVTTEQKATATFTASDLTDILTLNNSSGATLTFAGQSVTISSFAGSASVDDLVSALNGTSALSSDYTFSKTSSGDLLVTKTAAGDLTSSDMQFTGTTNGSSPITAVDADTMTSYDAGGDPIPATCDTLTGGAGADIFELSAATLQSTATTDTATTIITDFSTADGDTLKIGSLGAGSGTAYAEDATTYNSLSALLTAADAKLDGTIKYVAAMFNGDTYIVADNAGSGHSAIVQLQGVSLDQLDDAGGFITA